MCDSPKAVATLVLKYEFGRDEPCRNIRYDYLQCRCVFLKRCNRHPRDHLTLCCRCPDPKATFSIVVLDEKCKDCQYKEVAERSTELSKKLERARNELQSAVCTTSRRRITPSRSTTRYCETTKRDHEPTLRIRSARLRTLSSKVADMKRQLDSDQDARRKTLSSAGIFGVTGMDKIGDDWWRTGEASTSYILFTGETDESLGKWRVSAASRCSVRV